MLRGKDCLMEHCSATLSSPWSYQQRVASSTSTTSEVTDSPAVSSRFTCCANNSGIAPSGSKPVVVSSDSGIFTDISVSASDQTGDTQASRSSSSQSVDRFDGCVDKPNNAVRCSSSNADRPTSALSRGVQIVEYPRWNPQPLPSSNEESMMLMEEYLCPRKLVSVKKYSWVKYSRTQNVKKFVTLAKPDFKHTFNEK